MLQIKDVLKMNNKDKTLVWHKGRTNLYYLCTELLGMDLTVKVHLPVCNLFVHKNPDLPWNEQDEVKSRLLLDPRGHYKTTIDCADAIQWVICFPNIRIKFWSGSEDLVAQILDTCRKHFIYNEVFKAIYPEHAVEEKDAWKFGNTYEFTTPARTDWTLRDPTFSVSTINSTSTGGHSEISKYDDVVTPKNSNTKDLVAKTIRDTKQTFPIVMPGGYRDFIGTTYAESDLYAWCQEQAAADPSLWKVHKRGASTLTRTKDGSWDIAPDCRVLFTIDGKGEKKFDGRQLVLGGGEMVTDAAPPARNVTGKSAYSQATGSTTGGNVNVSAGLGRRFYTFVTPNSTGGKTFTVTANGTAVVFTEGAGGGFGFACNTLTTSQCATNLAAAINADATLSPLLTATPVAANVYFDKKSTLNTLTIATNAGAPATATQGTNGATVINGNTVSIVTGNSANTASFSSAGVFTPNGGSAWNLSITGNDAILGGGATFLRRSVESVATTKAPVAATESNEIYVSGDADGQTITLPNDPATLGNVYTVCVDQTQTSNSTALAPNTGESILNAGTVATTSCTATQAGACITVVNTSTGSGAKWNVIAIVGTWSCT